MSKDIIFRSRNNSCLFVFYFQKGFFLWHLCFLSLLSHCVVHFIFSNVLVCPYLHVIYVFLAFFSVNVAFNTCYIIQITCENWRILEKAKEEEEEEEGDDDDDEKTKYNNSLAITRRTSPSARWIINDRIIQM